MAFDEDEAVEDDFDDLPGHLDEDDFAPADE